MGLDTTKRQHHAEAQCNRDKNLELTRQKAEERIQQCVVVVEMGRNAQGHRKRANRTAEEVAAAAEKHQEGDVYYNEYRRRCKFVAKYGHAQFMEYYFPLYKKLGKKHLPGLQFAWVDEEAARQHRAHIHAHKCK
ncbi:hypothetical protein C8R45DRAFT_1100777 [Mycena sanguinolenta]|nr:hypothetical protein C8R45DRAFT_1100777 [Mycena sanguinolenta]